MGIPAVHDFQIGIFFVQASFKEREPLVIQVLFPVRQSKIFQRKRRSVSRFRTRPSPHGIRTAARELRHVERILNTRFKRVA